MYGITFGKHSRLSGGAPGESNHDSVLIERGHCFKTELHIRQITHTGPAEFFHDVQRVDRHPRFRVDT